MGNKNKLHEELMRYGKVIKENTFDTARGVYTIRIIRRGSELFWHKMKNGVVVEINSLTLMGLG